MKSFKDYQPENAPKKASSIPPQAAADMESFVRKTLGQYEGKSGMEMLKTLLAQAEESKRAGTLTNEEIDEFYAQFSPMLNGLQRKKLQEIVAGLKQL